MQVLERRAKEGKPCAKAFLECVAQATAYLDIPIVPKVTGSGAIPAQSLKVECSGGRPSANTITCNTAISASEYQVDKNPALGKQVASLAVEASEQEAFANPGPESWVGVNPRNLSAEEICAEKEAQSEEAGSGAIPAQTSEPAQLECDVVGMLDKVPLVEALELVEILSSQLPDFGILVQE